MWWSVLIGVSSWSLGVLLMDWLHKRRERSAKIGFWAEMGMRAQDHTITPKEIVAVFERWFGE